MSSLNNNVIKRSFKIDDELSSILVERYPGWTFIGSGKSNHPHPVGALERVVCEELAYRDIIRAHPNATIVDIGGNANRHKAAGRDVHSCNPILSPEDAVRRHPSNYMAGAQYCNQNVFDCDIVPDVYLSVHSLYYLTPSEVLKLVMRSKKKMLVAVVHKFDDVVGVKHFNGRIYESHYQLQYENNSLVVDMSVNGNMSSYKHDAMQWINSLYHCENGAAMAWNGTQVGDSWILKFVESPVNLSRVVVSTLPLIDSLKSNHHVGDVTGVLSADDAAILKPSLEFCEIADAKISSLYGFVIIQKLGQRKIILPKGIISNVAAKMVGMERDSKSLLTCIRYMQAACSKEKLKYQLPGDILVDCKTYGASLAFIYSMEKEIVAFNKLCSYNNQGKIAKLRSIMRMDGFFELPSLKYAAALTAFAGSLYILNKVGPKFVLNKTKAGAALAVTTAGGAAFHYLFMSSVGQHKLCNYVSSTLEKCTNLVNSYDNTRCSIPDSGSGESSWPSGLPSTTCDRPLSAPRKDSICSHPELEVEVQKNDFYIVAPVFSNYIPIVPAANMTNEVIAVRNRGIMKVPSPNASAWLAVKQFARKQARDLPEVVLDSDSFQEWNSKFPPNRRKQHVLAHQKLQLEPIETRDCYRSSFVKRELTMKGGEEFEDFDPRLIQGVSDKANVCLGPFMHKFSKVIAAKWNLESDIFYTCGSDAETLGLWREQFKDEDVTLIEVDFTRYDAHQGKSAHSVERIFYEAGGLNNYPDAAYVFDSQSNTVGFTSKGVFYKVKYTRKSGDPNTSTGNSLINGCCAGTILEKYGYKYKMVVQGDDNLIVLRGRLDTQSQQNLRTLLVAEYLLLGLVAKVKISTDWHNVEFCSSLFWPVEGGYVLGPKIGRRLPKIGFSMKQLTPGQTKGMLLGLMKETRYIPVLNEYAKICLKMLSHVKKEDYYVHENQYKIRASRNHIASQDTNDFFLFRYGVTAHHMNSSLRSAMDRVERDFKSVIDWPDLEHLLEIDL